MINFIYRNDTEFIKIIVWDENEKRFFNQILIFQKILYRRSLFSHGEAEDEGAHQTRHMSDE